MKLVQFVMGLDDCYQPVRSALLTRDPLLDVKDAYTTVLREESHKGVLKSSSVTKIKMNATSFEKYYDLIGYPPRLKKVANPIKQSSFIQNLNANVDVKTNEKQQSAPSLSSSSFTIK
ncbi:hypothetical protein Tco_0456638 [Tanacetum coccineum]